MNLCSASTAEFAPPPRDPAFAKLIGDSAALRLACHRAARVAPTRTPVLVTGESGTGKELIARVLHDLGPCPQGPFVAVNCGALPHELAESELFGHERGSFTGAAGRRTGWFEEAQGGTLVLDEIGELPPALQPKLLRVIETGHLRRVGGAGEIPVKVRIVALTLRDLPRECRKGSFRVDLFHRLAGFQLALPSLRERPNDVPILAQHFLKELRSDFGVRELSPSALDLMLRHDWPGNVRELRNALRRAMVLSDRVIGPEHLELCEFPRADDAPQTSRAADAPDWPASPPSPDLDRLAQDLLPLQGRPYVELEKEILAWALDRNGGSQRQAARALGISRSTFSDRIRRLGVIRRDETVSGVG